MNDAKKLELARKEIGCLKAQIAKLNQQVVFLGRVVEAQKGEKQALQKHIEAASMFHEVVQKTRENDAQFHEIYSEIIEAMSAELSGEWDSINKKIKEMIGDAK